MRDLIWLNSSPLYFPCRPGPADRIVGEAGDDVPVAMVNLLAGDGAVVDDHVEPLGARGGLDGTAEPGEKRAGVGGDLVRELFQVRVVRAWYEERMTRIERVDVEEDHGVGRLEQPGRGDLAPDDLAEDAVRILHGMRHDAALPG